VAVKRRFLWIDRPVGAFAQWSEIRAEYIGGRRGFGGEVGSAVSPGGR